MVSAKFETWDFSRPESGVLKFRRPHLAESRLKRNGNQWFYYPFFFSFLKKKNILQMFLYILFMLSCQCSFVLRKYELA